MTSPRTSRITSALGACLLAALAWTVLGDTARAGEPNGFVVHEWGTFSTFSGSDGINLKFTPNDGDLPPFVYNRHRYIKGGLPDAMVSLETPVMYFYSDRERTVSVEVDFPKGVMTDWYPQASRPPVQGLRWDNIKLLAKGNANVTNETGKSRYFAARETDSSVLHISEMGKTQAEKFLFYRGVADMTMPFVVKAAGNGGFTVRNTGTDEVPAFILVRVEGQKVYFKVCGHLSPRAEVKVQESIDPSTAEKLGDAVATLLVEQGLYEKEARAMVKTWAADWFGDEGTRVLYLVPESQTDAILPARIDPKPEKLVRVLVGRHDILTPEREGQIDAVVKRLNSNSNSESKAADAALERIGRYRWAAQSASASRLKANEAAPNRR